MNIKENFCSVKYTIEFFHTLYRHRRLSQKRSFSYQQNRVAKFMLGIICLFIIAYLMLIAVTLSLAVNNDKSITPIEFILGISPFILTLDFLFRFIVQQTPAQLIKPYVLLPVPRHLCIDSFIVSSLFSIGNFIWFALLIPYIIMSVFFSYGLLLSLGLLLFYVVIIFANSQWYAIVRTLINDHIAWWILPMGIYAFLYSPSYIGEKSGIDNLCDTYAKIGTSITDGSPFPYIVAAILLFIVIFCNRKLQSSHIMKELSHADQNIHHKIRNYSFLSTLGEYGKYFQLEVKMTLRNKNPRKSFIFSSLIILIFSLLISFSKIYDSKYYANFFCLYNYVIFGSMILIKIMCYEANFIDCLMVKKENILLLLRAKYFFYSIILIFPFLLMLPTVFMEKWSLLMLVSYAVFTAGVQYFILFQMAVYNTQTIPLNTKYISRSGFENNYFQVGVEMICLFIPMTLASFLQTLIGDTKAYILMLVLGTVFIALHKVWLRNIYTRMMKRKYKLLDSYHTSK